MYSSQVLYFPYSCNYFLIYDHPVAKLIIHPVFIFLILKVILFLRWSLLVYSVMNKLPVVVPFLYVFLSDFFYFYFLVYPLGEGHFLNHVVAIYCSVLSGYCCLECSCSLNYFSLNIFLFSF